MAVINFFSEEIDFQLSHPRKTSSWIKKAIAKESHVLKELNIIFCSDGYLAEINLQFLNHNTFTDIITFDESEGAAHIQGDIFISIDRVNENAQKFKTTFDNELHRVMVHGALHLMGYNDKGDHKITMREKEDAYLSLR